MAEPAVKKAETERVFLFSSESVNEGHPDKLCDQVSDAVLDACLTGDPKKQGASRTTRGVVFLPAAHSIWQHMAFIQKTELAGFDAPTKFVDTSAGVAAKARKGEVALTSASQCASKCDRSQKGTGFPDACKICEERARP